MRIVGGILKYLFYIIIICCYLPPVLTFLYYLFYPEYCLLQINKSLFWIACVPTTIDIVCFLCIIILPRLIHVKSLFYYRIITHFLTPILIPFFIGVGFYCYNNDIVDILFSPIAWILIYVCYLLYFLRQSIFIYNEKDFILYLRPFSFDESEKKLNVSFEEENVLKIGDPSKLSSGIIGEELFLPMSRWKESVSYYLSRASLVFLVLGDTDGSMWEAYESTNYIDKTIFYFKDRNTAKQVLLKYNDIKSKSVVFECIQKIINKDIENGCFYIQGNMCYYGDLELAETVRNCLNTNKLITEYDSFEIETNYFIGKKDPFQYHYYDLIRRIKYYTKKAKYSVVFIIMGVFYILAMILAPIIFLILLLMLIVVLFPSLSSNEYIQWLFERIL